LFKASEAISSD